MIIYIYWYSNSNNVETSSKERTTNKTHLIKMLSHITSSLNIPIFFNGKELTTDFDAKTIFDNYPDYDINFLYNEFGINASEIVNEKLTEEDEILINKMKTLTIVSEKEVQNSNAYSSATYKKDKYFMPDTHNSDTCYMMPTITSSANYLKSQENDKKVFLISKGTKLL